MDTSLESLARWNVGKKRQNYSSPKNIEVMKECSSKRKLEERKVRKIIELSLSGEYTSATLIAKDVGVSIPTVNNYLRKYGLKIKKPQ